MIAAHRTGWNVEDGWITLHGLGDPVDDVIASADSRDNKVRLSAAIALGKRAVALSTDKRGIPAMFIFLGDADANIRAVAASAFAIPGWIDATVDGCIRNRLIARLQSNEAIDPNAIARAAAAAAAKLMLELGMLDPAHLPIAEKCGIVRLPPPINVGPFVDPNDPNKPLATTLSTGEKVAIAGAAAVALGVLGYAMLGGGDPAQVRRRVKRR